MDRAKVLDKIKKCMALGKSPNEHEAAAAMRQAQKLIERNGITDIELGAVGIAGAKVLIPIQANNKFPAYLNFLLRTIENACGVKVVITSEKRVSDFSYVVHYVGPEHRTIMAEYAHAVLFSAMNKSWTAYLKEHLWLKKERGARSSYFMGWIYGVQSKISDYGMTSEERAGASCYIESKFGVLDTTNLSKTQTSNALLRAGVQAAESFQLNRAMDGEELLKIGE